MSRIKQLFFTLAVLTVLVSPTLVFASQVTLFFAPSWSAKAEQAKEIADALTKDSGVTVQPRIAKSYNQIMTAFSTNRPVAVYVGSFAQAILIARGYSVPLVQGINGQEFYSAVLVTPKGAGSDPVKVVQACGDSVAYTIGASSGETGAKAATAGRAAIGTNNHGAAVNAVKAGKAKCAFVKSWWWEGNKGNYPEMQKLDYPGISDQKNPDNILSTNKGVPAGEREKLKAAAIKNAKVFGVKKFDSFDQDLLRPSLALMQKGKIDPNTYSW
jgi:ABC-type phosphate/phosphonate transport system substrate-binding protein